jgi:hypothetical protein
MYVTQEDHCHEAVTITATNLCNVYTSVFAPRIYLPLRHIFEQVLITFGSMIESVLGV